MNLLTETHDRYFERYNWLYDKLAALADEKSNSEPDFENIALLVSEIKDLFKNIVELFKSLIKEIRINLIYLTSNELLMGYRNYIIKCFEYSEIEGGENLPDKKVLDDYGLNEHDITLDQVIVIATDVVITNYNIMLDMKERVFHEFEYEKSLRKDEISYQVKRPAFIRNISIYESFDSLFKPAYKKYISDFVALLQVSDNLELKPVLDEDGNYIKGRAKQAFVAWYEALSGDKGITINMTSRNELARLLNERFPGLDISESACKGVGPRGKSYKEYFNAEVSALKGNLQPG